MKSKTNKIILAVAILVVMGTVLFTRHQDYSKFLEEFDYSKAEATGLPVLLELGFESCPPCKMMKPILKNLKNTHSEEFSIGYIDINYNNEAMRKYDTNAFPTLIFLSKEGEELYRQIGYMPEVDILAKWKELGVINK